MVFENVTRAAFMMTPPLALTQATARSRNTPPQQSGCSAVGLMRHPIKKKKNRMGGKYGEGGVKMWRGRRGRRGGEYRF